MADLFFRKAVFSVNDPGFAADEHAEAFHGLSGPRQGKELGFSVIAVTGIADDFNEVVDVCEGDEVALELLSLNLGSIE